MGAPSQHEIVLAFKLTFIDRETYLAAMYKEFGVWKCPLGYQNNNFSSKSIAKCPVRQTFTSKSLIAQNIKDSVQIVFFLMIF